MKDTKQQLGVLLFGLISAAVIMGIRGIFSAESFSQGLLYACDGFSVSGIIFLCAAGMMRIAGEGTFDMLEYAVRKGIHHIIPAKFGDDAETFYDYKTGKQNKKTASGIKAVLISGAVNFIIGLLLTAVWYSISGG